MNSKKKKKGNMSTKKCKYPKFLLSGKPAITLRQDVQDCITEGAFEQNLSPPVRKQFAF